jgi:hypothetical protein
MQVSQSAPHQTTLNITTDSTKESNQTPKEKNSNELSADELQAVAQLQARDTEVRAHEAAHQAAGAGMTGSASYTYQQGPDGKMYAVGGEVPITIKEGSTPQEKIANARQVEAAAMAPANPSSQDYAVASSARVMEMRAQQELTKEQQEKLTAQSSYNKSSLTLNNTTQTEQKNSIQAFDVTA